MIHLLAVLFRRFCHGIHDLASSGSVVTNAFRVATVRCGILDAANNVYRIHHSGTDDEALVEMVCVRQSVLLHV